MDANKPPASYRDLRAHIEALDREGLLHRIDHPVNKDTELHPLVRWQYRGGIPDEERKAFYFTNVTDSKGRQYDYPILVAGLAGSRRIYAVGMQCSVEEIGDRWKHALAHPLPPTMSDAPAPAQEVVHTREELESWGGLLNFPTPISTPGWDNAPYLTSAHYITKDPETGVRNVGNYRAQIKSATRCGVRFSGRGCDAHVHWHKAKAQGKHLEIAVVIGAPPVVSFTAAHRMPIELDELAVAGALVGAPLSLVKCKTVDLEVPVESEVVIEGIVRSDFLEPEGPFGESTGFVHQRTESHVIEVTCITHRRAPIWTSFISQVTPSESSTIKAVAYEPVILDFLRNTCGIKSLTRVVLHEALTNIRPIVFLQFKKTSEGEIWRAMKLVSGYARGIGKIVVAVDEDIDPKNLDAVMWSMAYRMTPHKDVQIIRGFDKVGPPFRDIPASDNSVMLINATLREKMPPVSLPKREFMERSLELWREIGLPPVKPEAPWFGYSLGEWWDELDEEAKLATESRWTETGEKNLHQRKPV
jgi:UbiD family decarboxylase